MFGKQKINFIFENGIEVESNISGFKGMITSRAQHLHSCNRYYVNPKVDKDGKLPDGYWFDEAEIIEIEPATLEPQNTNRGGFHSKLK